MILWLSFALACSPFAQSSPLPCILYASCQFSAALVCYEDIYVDRVYSEETAALLGDRLRAWVTNEYQHSGLGDDGAKVWRTLTGMTSGEVVIPSP